MLKDILENKLKTFLAHPKLLIHYPFIFSAILMGLPFQFDNLFFLPLFSFMPLAVLLISKPTPSIKTLVIGSYLFSFIYYAFSLQWFSVFLTGGAQLVMLLYGTYLVITLLLTRILLQYFYSLRFFIIPSTFTIFEFSKTLLTLQNSIGTFGISAHHFLTFIQSANIFGVYGINFILCLLGTLLADFWLNRKSNPEKKWYHFSFSKDDFKNKTLTVYTVIILINLAYGVANFVLYSPSSDKNIRVSLIQQWFDYNKRNDTDVILEKVTRLTNEASDFNPQLIAYAENMWPKYYRDQLSANNGTSMLLKQYFQAYNEGLPTEKKAHFMLGSLDFQYIDSFDFKYYEKLQKNPSPDKMVYKISTPFEGQQSFYYSTSFFLSPTGDILNQTDKKRLVPFGETVPFETLRKYLSDSGRFEGFDIGTTMDVFTLGNVRFVSLICFEDFFSDFVNQYNKLQPDFYIVPTNDAWSYTITSPMIHQQMSVFRSIESGRPILRVGNAGYTAYLNPLGQVMQNLPLYTEGFLNVDLHLPNTPRYTLYQQLGDIIVFISMLFIATLFTVLVILNIRRKYEN